MPFSVFDGYEMLQTVGFVKKWLSNCDIWVSSGGAHGDFQIDSMYFHQLYFYLDYNAFMFGIVLV